MSDRKYTNTDGTSKEELIAEKKATLAANSIARGVDPELVESLMSEVWKNGYVIIKDLMPQEIIEMVKEKVLPLLGHDGRNEFEGYKTRRIYSVIEKTLEVNPFMDNTLILALLDTFFMPNYLLSQIQAINVLPGEIAQPLHADDGFYPIPRPRAPIGAATIWAIDDFTEENGATVIIPKSHLWGDEYPGDGSGHELVSAVMPAGSVIFFLGTAWHGAGANNSDASRMAVTTQYCEPWARQQENYGIAISRERVKLCSKDIQKMLGYSMLFPFIGFVNGRDPIRLLE
jgi:hypothetical protein